MAESIYDQFNKSLYKTGVLTMPGGAIDLTADPSLFSSDNIVEFGQFRNISVGGVILTVAKGDDIQKAINRVSELGGGEVRMGVGTFFPIADIVVPANTSLVGAGRDVTILDFGSAARGLKATGTAGAILKNVKLRDFTVQNSNNTAGVDFDYTDFFFMENVRVTSCDQKGFRVQHARSFELHNCYADLNIGHGYQFASDVSREMENFFISNCIAYQNGGAGFYFYDGNNTGSTKLNQFTATQCTAQENDNDGFRFERNSASTFEAKFIACHSELNGFGPNIGSYTTARGFNFVNAVNLMSFIACIASTNADEGFWWNGFVNIVGCTSTVNGADEFHDATTVNTGALSNAAQTMSYFVGNTSLLTVLNDATPADYVDLGEGFIFSEIPDGGIVNNRKFFRMKNTSGGGLVPGDVVILKSVATAYEVTTTTTAGDNKVFGMVMNTIDNDHYTFVLTEGFTTKLKVDGTTDIAIGDWLSCFTTAKIAQKASAGHTVFAMALEAYTTNDSAGVINALLVTPRLI